jgi:K+-sensing histidine kinase KdpD
MSNSEPGSTLAIDISTLLASSVHDIKNSLGMLIGTLDDLVHSKNFESKEDKQQLLVLQSEASRINSSLIHLLGLYRLQQDKLPLQIKEVFVSDLLEETVAGNENLFELQNINVTIDCDPDLAWYFDSQLIGSVINNILINALKYTQKSIAIKAWIENDALKICIDDDGRGYPETILLNQDATTHAINFATGSTNLGLFFAAHISHAHERKNQRGFIVLSNHDNGGGRFTLTLP